VATRASVLLQRTYREVRGQLMDMAMGLNVTGSAEDREQVYNMVRRRFARLSRMIDQLTVDAVQEAARAATKTASDMTGVEIKYSARRAEAITELVTPAQGENLAAVFTDRMSRRMINALRQATVDTMREQAVEGGSLKGMTGELLGKWRQIAQDENPQFVDASGRTWDTRAYLSMNVRTNAMRVYNDCLVDAVARETGSDLMKISSNGSDSTCICAAWEGVIVSLTGATKGLPTYEDARNAGCFHPNCVHTLQVVDEYADKAEIELQKAHPVKEEEADDPDAADERKYEMDKDRYVRTKGMTEEQARVAVDRDNLTDNIRTGLLREDARQLVDGMTDKQVTALCPGGNPPRFEPFKPTKKEREAGAEEKWNHGSRGGVFHIARNSTLEHLLEVGKVLNAGGGADASKGGKSASSAVPVGSEAWLDAEMAKVGGTDAEELVNGVLATEFGMTGHDRQRAFYRMPDVSDPQVRLKTAQMAVVCLRDLKARFPNADIKLEELCFRGRSSRANACATLDHQGWRVSTMHIAWHEFTQSEIDHIKNGIQNNYIWTRKHPDKRANCDTFRHEFGHILTTREVQREFKRVCRQVGGLRYFKQNVSEYAGTKQTEAIAEIFNYLTAHDYVRGTLDRRVEDFVYCTMLKEPKGT